MRPANAYAKNNRLGIPRVMFASCFRLHYGLPKVMFTPSSLYRGGANASLQPFPFFYGYPDSAQEAFYLALKRLFSREFYKDMLALAMPARALPAVLAFAAGTIMAGSFAAEKLVFGVAMLMSAYCAAAVFNNISDIEGDKLNNPASPLASGRYTTGFAWGLMAIFTALAFLLGSLVSPIMILVNLFYVFMGIAYSKFTKGYWPLSYATLITTHLLTPLAVGYFLSTGFADTRLVVILCFMLLTEFFAFSIKDYKDVEGDRKMGMSTMPVSLGTQGASRLTSFGLLLPVFSIWVPWTAFRLSYLFLLFYFAAWLMRASMAVRLVNDQSPAAASEMVKKYRIILLLQMCAWCIAWV
ncbi:MAG TPA: UbiA family prenyltransferase [Candidatus Micrarchaeota archaeon]|nr:UbiA family prenyltransferase [Candidatus Micrarchaeota archaeon]